MQTTVEKELNRLSRAEERMRQKAHKDELQWKKDLENKIPEKVLTNLQGVFYKAFQIIFDKGTELIEKTYKKEEITKIFLYGIMPLTWR